MTFVFLDHLLANCFDNTVKINCIVKLQILANNAGFHEVYENYVGEVFNSSISQWQIRILFHFLS